MRTDTPQMIRLADYTPPSYLIDTVQLDVKLAPDATRIESRLAMRPNPDFKGPRGALKLDGEELKLEGIEIDGMPVPAEAYTIGTDSLTLNEPPAAPFTLRTIAKIDPSANTQLMGLYRSNGVYTTQCEAEGFRRITWFLDRPDVLSVYTTRIEARKSDAPILLSNGNPVEEGDIAGTDRHFAVWHDPHPKPCYLFALVGGDLALVREDFTTRSGRPVDLRVYVEQGNEGQAAFAMDALIRSMRWDEEAFGREYDLDVFSIVAVSHFNMGAMENKGLNVFNDKYVLAAQETATDSDYEGVEAVIAHEYFHNWTGNRITCRDWFQLCLKEGLTVFRDQEFTSDTRSRPVKRIQDVRLLRTHQFSEDAGPLAHPVRPEAYREINNFYTATVYEKGAEVIRMLKTLIGDDAFARGMDLYFDRHDGDAATIEEFIACFAEVSGRDLAQFMLWYRQAGTPEVAVTTSHDAASGTFTIDLAQTCPPTPGQTDKAPMTIPVRFALLGPDGEEIVAQRSDAGANQARDGLIELSEANQTVTFTGIAKRPVVSLLRDFSAPVKLKDDLSKDDRLFLLRHDADPFNRWQAAQTMLLSELRQAQSDARKGRSASVSGDVVDAVLEAAGNTGFDDAFRAELLKPPSFPDVAQAISDGVDPDAIHVALETLRSAFAKQGGTQLAGIIDAATQTGAFSADAAATGQRALKNAALALYAADSNADALKRAREQFDGANNMTDRIGALGILVQRGKDSGSEALETFFERYRSYPLVIDKWFALQATVPSPDTLDRVVALMDNAAFSIRNPNRVRALIGSFAAANPVAFNRKDGAGYNFVADQVLELNKLNPQVAARMLGAFRSWKTLESARKALARKALERIAGAEGLSSDVADIVTRSLSDS
ncbi:MAG: aminopeptidase N [Rhodobiaceae bacterium]|nr:aminopeptidase N [Rhodobiaceae bacterium]MCC0048549.1 aminopeptidase N [Rhodobiaceae bacterium]